MGIDDARSMAAQVESRTLTQSPWLPPTPEELVRAVRKCLLTAADEDILINPQYQIHKLLKMDKKEGRAGSMVAILMGGATIDKGQETDEFFLRRDGARISFGVTLMYGDGGAPGLVSFRFSLRFPDGVSPRWVRFDLNERAGDPLLEPRCHAHSGADCLRIATPLMGPTEILGKLLHGMPVPGPPLS